MYITFINLTVKNREDSSFDPEDWRVQVLAVTVNVELDVIVAKAEHVPLLELGGEAVLLCTSGPHHALGGNPSDGCRAELDGLDRIFDLLTN